jgi:polyketide biosynthesis enoyl-CoA hydratase PksI
MSADAMTPERVGEGILSLRLATDEAPYIEADFQGRLATAVDAVKADSSARVVLLEGGARYFSAGASRESLLRSDASSEIPRYAAALPLLVLEIPLPTIAVMAGHAIGGGFALGLLSDLPLLAEESLYGMNFMALGFTPGMGSTVLLEEAFGARLARELLFTGRLLKGRELQAAGAHAVLPKAEVRARALQLAAEVAAAPREALLALKAMLAGRRRERLSRALEEERQSHEALFSLGDTARRIAERYPEVPLGEVRR